MPTTTALIGCPECGHDTAYVLPGLDEGEPDLAVCGSTGCDAEWELPE